MSIQPLFDGLTLELERDHARLSGQMERVMGVMCDGRWHTIPEVARIVGGSENGVGARFRDMRKPRFGGHTVERQYVGNGLFEYRLVIERTQPA